MWYFEKPAHEIGERRETQWTEVLKSSIDERECGRDEFG